MYIMSTLSQFKNKDNLKLLWDVLLDELNINSSNKSLVNNIRTVFESNINPFTVRSNPKTNIMELNKQFLSQVVLAVNRLFPNITQEQNIKRITITDEEVSEPYKIEDIHASRQNEFEKEVERKRMEMENYMTPQKPRDLDFSDKNSDGKIKAMDSLVADKMAERNMEFEQLQNGNYYASLDPETWLTSKETSVKNDKQIVEQRPIVRNNQSSKLKYISIDNSNNITLNIDELDEKSQHVMKRVSWDDLPDKESTLNIFNKLKKQPIIEMNKNDNIDLNNEAAYIEQKSMPLPNVKQEEIVRNKSTLPNPNNEPIIPKTEIIKQLNVMNKKINDIYDLVYKIASILEKNNVDILEKNNDILEMNNKEEE